MSEPAMQVIVLDVETTGKERATDQIIELCIQFGLGAEAASRTWRIRPEVLIHPEAAAVHGITMEALVGCPSFLEVAREFVPLMAVADVIVGYNVAFDLDMIQAEIVRAGIPPLSFAGKQVVDVLRLWHHVEPRTLVAAHMKFCGETMVDAHQATADVAATARVLSSMLVTFGLSHKGWSEIAMIANPFVNRASWIGPSAHVQWDESGAVVFGFGKHKGQQVVHVDVGFLRWVLSKDFPPHVKKICGVALEKPNRFGEWIATYYPRFVEEPVKLEVTSDLFAQTSSFPQGVLL